MRGVKHIDIDNHKYVASQIYSSDFYKGTFIYTNQYHENNNGEI